MAKYKIGDWLTLDGCGDKIKFRVISLIEETCSGGTQVFYVCRQFMYDVYSKQWIPAISKINDLSLLKYNEIELQPYVETLKI